MREGAIPNTRSRSWQWAALLVVTLGACGGDDDAAPGGATPDGGATQSSASTGPRAEATAACLDACDHQIGAGCSGTTEIFRPFCEGNCERTTDQTLEDCVDELLALQRCRGALEWECDGFGGSQPTTSCATESGACLQCMGGKLCDALSSGLAP